MGPGVPPKQPVSEPPASGHADPWAYGTPEDERVRRAIRRSELGDFLRTRRAAITPAEVGITVSGHRKTPGLRREEVAQLAGVGLSWYTWLEQAREITPSAQVLKSIGRVLRLDQVQTDHLFHLAGLDIPDSSTSNSSTEGLDFEEIVRSLLPHAAYVLSPRFDVVAHNANAELILGDLAHRAPGQRNLLRWLFDDPDPWPGFRKTWAIIAHANLLDFRVEYARHAGDPSYERLVGELCEQNEQFRTWWVEHGVEVPGRNHRRLPHSQYGVLKGHFIETRPIHQPDYRLRIVTAADKTTKSIFAENQGPTD